MSLELIAILGVGVGVGVGVGIALAALMFHILHRMEERLRQDILAAKSGWNRGTRPTKGGLRSWNPALRISGSG